MGSVLGWPCLSVQLTAKCQACIRSSKLPTIVLPSLVPHCVWLLFAIWDAALLGLVGCPALREIDGVVRVGWLLLLWKTVQWRINVDTTVNSVFRVLTTPDLLSPALCR